MPSICQQLQIEYQALKAKKQEFDLAYEEARSTGNPNDLKEARKLMKELKEKRNILQEMTWPFKELERKNLQEQYNFQKKTFEDLGILERLSTGEMGIKAINGTEYAFPSFQNILVTARKNKEVLKTKTEQGFSELLIVPFGMKLDDLIEKYKELLWKHYEEKKLFATMENKEDKPVFPDDLPFDQDTVDKIKSGQIKYEEIWENRGDVYENENSALWAWDKYQNADETGELKYYPQEFSDNHHGKTKQDILEKEGKTPGAGFNIILTEDMPNIPRDNPKTKGGRTSIDIQGSSIKKYIKAGETIPSSNEYLQAINTEPMYRHEIGMTPEDQIIYNILYLKKHNQIVDDCRGKGSISYQFGAYVPASGYVPSAYWDDHFPRAFVGWYFAWDRFENCGIRPAVRVNLEI